MRPVICLILPFVILACGDAADTDLPEKPTETVTTTDTTTTTTTATTTATTTTTTTTIPAPTVGAGPYGLEGTWFTQSSQGGQVTDVTWTLTPIPNCTFEAVVTGVTQTQFPCTYNADATTLVFNDGDCQDPGTYAYTVAGPVLSLSVIDEPCQGRAAILANTWDLIAP